MSELLWTISAIALLDSINPNAVAAQVYLLTTPKPVPRSIAFILGEILAAWIAGMLIAFGMMQLIAKVFNQLGAVLFILQFLLGIALLYLGWNFQKLISKTAVKRPKSLKPSDMFLFGFMLAFTEAPTALPYLAAIEQMTRTNPSLTELALLLLFYDVIFVLPLILLVVVYVIAQNRSTQAIALIQEFVSRWFPVLFQVVLILLGIVLIADSIAQGFGRSVI
ncbi:MULTISPECIES: GAP family protein [Leptolyngbya]|uniref:GAP family protein n=1 Tax=Leptolyngbya boryana CZ1 TaxID=3060204 RepID=A0AA96WPP0_LEPBY|nr:MULTISPECIES: GAP family protein [Leptolyngbya]MBD1858795.1 GAP family protein [Leptolyngbya sp. FACHB-1624]MCY6490509.1 GAP family protein [Leptolyngbya sp. GGD]WNZ43716.1 GAP family protein [Leptolyngbya boryana CZ1]